MAGNNIPLLEHLSQAPLLVRTDAEPLFRSCLSFLLNHADADKLTASMATEDEDFWPRSDDWRSAYRPYNVKNGILQIPVMGVLLNRFPWAFGRWATGYTYIEKAFQRGMADMTVKGIAFIHDSPGGEVAGCFELGDKLYAGRGQKPMRAFVADHSYSASFNLSSAVGPISVTRSGGVGSVGVVTAHVSYEGMLKDIGIKVTFIHAGKHKVDGNPYENLPDDVKSRIQERIDKLYSVFVGAVSRNRKMSEESVRKTEALTYDAEDAIKVGFADKIGSLEEEMVLFNADLVIGEEEMAEAAAQHDKDIADARAAGVAEGTTAGKAAGLKDGIAQERARITGILGCEPAKKRPLAALAAAIDTEMTVEQATAFLAKLAEEKPEGTTSQQQSHFDRAMGNGTGVEAGAGDTDADAGEGEDGKPTAKQQANRLLADYALAAGIPPEKKAAAA